MPFDQPFVSYTTAFLSKWWALAMGGGLFGLTAGADYLGLVHAKAFARASAMKIPASVKEVAKAFAILLGAFWAGYLVWSDEHNKKFETEKKLQAVLDQPSVNFVYDNTPKYISWPINTPTDKVNYRYVIFVDVETSRRLKGAVGRIKYIHPSNQDENAPIVQQKGYNGSDESFVIGWYGDDHFDKQTITDKKALIPFNLFIGGKTPRLSIFGKPVNDEQVGFFNDIPAGDYVIEIEVDDDSLLRAARQKFKVHWTGYVNGFSMMKCSECK